MMIDIEASNESLSRTVHDLRNDLCIILSNLDLLTCTPAEERALKRARLGAKRAETTIETLSKLAKKAVFPG